MIKNQNPACFLSCKRKIFFQQEQQQEKQHSQNKIVRMDCSQHRFLCKTVPFCKFPIKHASRHCQNCIRQSCIYVTFYIVFLLCVFFFHRRISNQHCSLYIKKPILSREVLMERCSDGQPFSLRYAVLPFTPANAFSLPSVNSLTPPASYARVCLKSLYPFVLKSAERRNLPWHSTALPLQTLYQN